MKKNLHDAFRYARKKQKILMIMKLSLILTIVLLVSNVQAGLSQKAMFTLKLSGVSVEKVFKEIESKSSFRFIYQSDDIENLKAVTIAFEEVDIHTILSECLEGSELEYLIEKDFIIIHPAKVEETDEQAAVEVSGKVTDSEGNPLPGATILEEGTMNGVVTDANGNYKLSVAGPASKIKISFIGFTTQIVEVGNKTILNIVLEESAESLSEVVITGYQTISKERATGSFAKISTEQIEKPASSISERLVGMVAGLNSTIDAEGNVEFEIRGKTSLFADAQPLIVVDGFAIEGNFSSINPNDVESITVLKDAAAASIWGAKSANGVIVITTKKAKKGQTKISVSSFIKMSSKLDLGYVTPWATSEEVINYEQNGFDSQFFGGPWGYPSASINSVIGTRSQAVVAMNEARLGRITEAERDAILNKLKGLDNKDQIRKYLLNTPMTQQHNVNISGGNDNMVNSLSLMWEDRNEFFKGNENTKYLVNYRNRVNVTDWMDFEFSGMLQYNERTRNGLELNSWGAESLASLAPFDMLVNEDGSLADMTYLKYYVPNLDAFIPKELFPYSDWSYNPIQEINSRDIRTKQLNTRIQAGLNFKIMKGLKYSTKIQYELFTTSNNSYYSEESYAARNLVNQTSEWLGFFGSPDVPPTQNLPLGGYLRQNKMEVRAYNFRNQIDFNRKFAADHEVNIVVGSEISSRVAEGTVYPDVFGYDDEKLTSGKLLNPIDDASMWNGYPLSYARFFFSANLEPTSSFTYDTERLFSLYGNGAYTYLDKYTVSGSFRIDASNLITDDPSYRYSPFWSASLGWQMAKEDFMSNVEWVDRLNARFTYGFNGNVDRSTSFLPLINVASNINPYTHEYTASISSFGNPSLRWEKTRSINLGFDFSLFQGKLNGSIDLYHKKGTDLIIQQSIPAINGTESQKFNNGEMVNKGIEIKLGSSANIVGDDIVWRGSMNFAYNKNRITKLFKAGYAMWDLWGGTRSFVEGHNASSMWSLRYAGVKNIGSETSPNIQPGFYGIDDAHYTFLSWPTGEATEYMSNEGTLVAPVTMGLSSSFKIYDFDVSFIITAKFGHVFRRQGFNYPAMTGGNTFVNSSYAEVLASDPSQVVPIPEQEFRYYFWDRFHPYLDYLTASASHIRFQELNINYRVPANILKKIGFKSASLYAQLNNLGTILFNEYGEDPEYPRGTLKPQTTYTFGLKFNL